MVPLRQGERETIETLEDWRKTLGVQELFVHQVVPKLIEALKNRS